MKPFLCDHDMHTHTFLSECCHDERMTVEAILEHAVKNHYSVQCITDHLWDSDVPGASKWYEPQNIAHVKENLPFPENKDVQLVFGCETEYCGNGKLGLKPEHFNEFGFVIIPPNHFHMEGFTRDPSINTPEAVANLFVERLEEISKLPIPLRKVGIAHITCGLMFRDGSKYDVIETVDENQFFDVMRVFAKAGTGIEINSISTDWKEHEESELKLYRIAKKAGCKFYLGSDSHSLEGLDRVQRVLTDAVQALELTDADRYYLP